MSESSDLSSLDGNENRTQYVLEAGLELVVSEFTVQAVGYSSAS